MHCEAEGRGRDRGLVLRPPSEIQTGAPFGGAALGGDGDVQTGPEGRAHLGEAPPARTRAPVWASGHLRASCLISGVCLCESRPFQSRRMSPPLRLSQKS